MSAAGQQGLPYRRPRGPGGPLARLAAAAGLLVLAALGAAARRVTHLSTAGLLTSAVQPVVVVTGLVAVIAGCLVLVGLIILLVRRRRPPEDEPEAEQVPIPWWARLIALLALVALVALPIAALVRLARARHGGTPAPAPVLVPPTLPRLAGSAPPAGTGGTEVLVAIAVVILAVLAVAALWLRRRARARAVPYRRAPQTTPLAAAVAAGSTALGAAAGPREAIIACYAAMEDTLAAAGSPRRAADTPEDLLRRAEGNGIIRTSAAGRLTALFREARFSPHELADAQRQAARAALDDISNDLAGGA